LVDLTFKDVIKFVILRLVPFIVIAIIVGILIVPLAVIFAIVIFAQLILPTQVIEPELLILVDVNVKIFAVDVVKVVEFNVDARIKVYKLNPTKHKYPRIFSRLTDIENVHLFKKILNSIEKKNGHVNLILSALPRMDRILSLIKDNRIYHVIIACVG
jgi:hypothetical protein